MAKQKHMMELVNGVDGAFLKDIEKEREQTGRVRK